MRFEGVAVVVEVPSLRLSRISCRHPLRRRGSYEVAVPGQVGSGRRGAELVHRDSVPVEEEGPLSILRVHRNALSANPNAFEADLPRLSRTFVPHLKRCGYRRVGGQAARPLVAEVVERLFEAQGRRPLFHVEDVLPYCWNAPRFWSVDYIRYEWGHLRSRNQNHDAEHIENLALCSARCNQHIQTSMDIEEVRQWLAGSRIARRIDEVLARRAALFASPAWKDLCARLAAFR